MMFAEIVEVDIKQEVMSSAVEEVSGCHRERHMCELGTENAVRRWVRTG